MSKVLSQKVKLVFRGGLQPVLIIDFHQPEVNFYSHRDGVNFEPCCFLRYKHLKCVTSKLTFKLTQGQI